MRDSGIYLWLWPDWEAVMRWCTSGSAWGARSSIGIGAGGRSPRARLRRFTSRRTQHCTLSSSVQTSTVRQPMYTSTIKSPPRFWPRSTLPAIISDTPVRIPAIKTTWKAPLNINTWHSCRTLEILISILYIKLECYKQWTTTVVATYYRYSTEYTT